MRTLHVSLLAISLFAAHPLQAADFCIASVADLQLAMDTIAQSPGESHRVRIVAGDYPIDYVGFSSSGALILEGGYDVGCLHKTFGAIHTVIHTTQADPQEASVHAFGGNLSVSDVAFEGYNSVFIFPQGVGHALTVSRVAIALDGNQWHVEMHTTDSSPVLVDDVIVDANSDACALEVSASELDFTTVVNRGAGRGLCSSGALLLKNSIVTALADVDIQAPVPLLAISSIYDEVDGGVDPASMNNLSDQVAFESTADPILRDRPANNSVQIARDSGTPLAIDFDVLGLPRVVGSAPDRGAFELGGSCDRIFQDGFDPAICPPLAHSHHRSVACTACP